MSRAAFELYGNQLLLDNARQFQDTKKWLDKILAGLYPYEKRDITREFARRNNKPLKAESGEFNRHWSASIYARNAARQKHRDRDCKFFRSLKTVYGDRAIFKTNVRAWAVSYAVQCKKILSYTESSAEKNREEVIKQVCLLIRAQGIEPPHFDAENEYPFCLRVISADWWNRRGERALFQMREHWQIKQGNVAFDRDLYVSGEGLERSQRQEEENAAFLDMFELQNEAGQTVDMAEMFNRSSACPEKRSIELKMRMRGLQELALLDGWVCEFVTWTAPSKYHATKKFKTSRKSKRNSKYNGATPVETNKYLGNQFQKCRAKLHRKGLSWYGLRVVEPHHDGTPHWHMIIFMPPEERAEIKQIIRHYATEHEKAELKKTEKPRIDFKTLDLEDERGGAVGYMVKYIAKNIGDGEHENEKDLEDDRQTIAETAKRATAWARIWRIRQYQFFGSASVTTYRELRRYTGDIPADVKPLFVAADKGDWATYQKLFAGYQPKMIEEVTGECNQWGELTAQVVGVEVLGFSFITRVSEWVKRKKQGDSPVTRSTVSNYSGVKNRQRFYTASEWELVKDLPNRYRELALLSQTQEELAA